MDFPVGYLFLTACLPPPFFSFMVGLPGGSSLWQVQILVLMASPWHQRIIGKGFSSLDKSSPSGPDAVHVHHPGKPLHAARGRGQAW